MNIHLISLLFVCPVLQSFFSEKGIELKWFWFRVEYQARGAPHVHGCLRLKADLGITNLGNLVRHGRCAQHILKTHDQLYLPRDECFDDTYDDWLEEENENEPSSQPNFLSIEEINKLEAAIEKGMRAEKTIVAFNDWLLSVWNPHPPLDAALDKRLEETVRNKTKITGIPVQNLPALSLRWRIQRTVPCSCQSY